MIVTTTNSIEGREISRYNDPIAANVVIGTTVFSDIGASYVDFFGDCSTCYEKMIHFLTNKSVFIWLITASKIRKPTVKRHECFYDIKKIVSILTSSKNIKKVIHVKSIIELFTIMVKANKAFRIAIKDAINIDKVNKQKLRIL